MFNMKILYPHQITHPTPTTTVNNHLGDGLEAMWKMFKLEIWCPNSG